MEVSVSKAWGEGKGSCYICASKVHQLTGWQMEGKQLTINLMGNQTYEFVFIFMDDIKIIFWSLYIHLIAFFIYLKMQSLKN